MASWRRPAIVALATIAGIWAALPTVGNAADADAGKQIFQEKCVACHTVGKGALVGPDLQGVTARRPREWLEQWIAAPDAMLAKKDPYATNLLHQFHDLPMPTQGLGSPPPTFSPRSPPLPMPNQGLGSSDITAILAYLETAAAQPSAAQPTAAPAAASATAVRGDPETGKDLFTGVARFHNGGPPCMACHSVGGIGALGG